MADELNGGVATGTPNEPGAPGQAFGTTPNEPGGQTSTPSTPQQSPEPGKQAVNWQDSPEFKKYQAQQDQRLTALQQKLAEQEQRQHEATMAQLSPEQRTQYQLQLAQQQLQNYQRQFQTIQEQTQRQKDIEELSKLSGAPAEVFAAAETYDQATRLALQYARENSPQALAERQAKQEANRVDLGAGSAHTTDERKVIAAREALARGDAMTFYKSFFE